MNAVQDLSVNCTCSWRHGLLVHDPTCALATRDITESDPAMPADVRLLRAAARVLRRAAIERFKSAGTADPRGAALWDAGCYIDPEYGDALHAWRKADESAPDDEYVGVTSYPTPIGPNTDAGPYDWCWTYGDAIPRLQQVDRLPHS